MRSIICAVSIDIITRVFDSTQKVNFHELFPHVEPQNASRAVEILFKYNFVLD